MDIDPGQIIFRKGDIGKGIYCLKSGLVVIGRSSRAKSKAACRLIFSGQLFGYDHYLTGERHHTTATALDQSTVRLFHRASLNQIAKSDPMFGCHLARIVRLDRLDLEGRLTEAYRLTARYRLVRLIDVYLTHRPVPLNDGGVRFRLPIKRAQIAECLGVSPETLSRAIRALRNEEFVYFAEQWIDIPSLTDFRNRILAIEKAFGI